MHVISVCMMAVKTETLRLELAVCNVMHDLHQTMVCLLAVLSTDSQLLSCTQMLSSCCVTLAVWQDHNCDQSMCDALAVIVCAGSPSSLGGPAG